MLSRAGLPLGKNQTMLPLFVAEERGWRVHNNLPGGRCMEAMKVELSDERKQNRLPNIETNSHQYTGTIPQDERSYSIALSSLRFGGLSVSGSTRGEFRLQARYIGGEKSAVKLIARQDACH